MILPRARPFAAVVLACAVAIGAFAACSGDDDPEPTSTAVSEATPAPTTAPTSPPPTAAPTPGSTSEVPTDDQPIVYESRAGGFTEVWTVNAVTMETKQITFDNAVSGHPAWSPDYSRIIFSSNREDRRNLYTMAADGTDIQRLTNQQDADHWAPKFSPDGTQVTYVEVTDNDGSYMALMNADGTGVRRISGKYRFAEFPAWTRDGKLIYFAAIEDGGNNIDIFSVDPVTLEVKTIVQTPNADVCPHFSRDGTIMTYASVAPGETENVDLFARPAPFDSHLDIGDDVRLTTDPGFDDYTNPSPDGATQVFLSRRDGNAELYLMDNDGGNQRRLTFTPDANENVPDW